MDAIGKAIAGALAFLGVAAVLYGVALFDIWIWSGNGLGEPCEFAAAAREGSRLTSSADFWPPGVTCKTHLPNGEVRVVTDEWGWIPAAIIGCGMAAVVCFGAGIAVQRRQRREIDSAAQ